MGSEEEPEDGLPNFWELLSEEDKTGYIALKSSLSASSGKRNRGHRIEAFDKVLNEIRQYAERNDENDWRRFLVCGVCWMDNMIAINTRQLRLLISKCKSSINGSFQKLGYSTKPSHTELWKYLFEKIPLLKDNFNSLRQWTIRCRSTPTQPFVAYADGKACIVSKDLNQPIHMQISVPPQFSKAAMRSDNQTVQLNVLIPQSAILQAQAVPSPIISMQDGNIAPTMNQSPQIIPAIQLQTAKAGVNVVTNIPLEIQNDKVPSKVQVKKEMGEKYCPLKYRTKLMHSKEVE